jgi:phosphoribosylformimino-5-aminoimidazole carboxamide ribotide isomerase
MRIVPVLDLKGGVAVHAVRGQRDAYAPVRSTLAESADPVALARAFRTVLGCEACYVADLDAITGRGDHGPTIRAIADVGLRVWLDAGVATAADADRAVRQGAGRVIVGTETLRETADLPAIAAAARGAGAGAILSLDLKEGRLLGGTDGVAGRDPIDLARDAWAAGFRSFIVLDLARVGAGIGVATGGATRLRQALPSAEVIVGGGVRDGADLRALALAGFDAALVATALHTGVITAADLAPLR